MSAASAFNSRARDLSRKAAELLARADALTASLSPSSVLVRYRDDPAGYARDVLHVTLTPSQQQVCSALLLPPRRVLVSSGHNVGKSLLGACLISWFFDTRIPGRCLTTAPNQVQVIDILWSEVRTLRAAAGLPDCWAGPKIPRLQTSPDHYAVGFTARDATRFQGRHSKGGLLIVFDEAEGIEQEFFRAAKSMLDDNSFFLAVYNPTGGPGSATHEAETQADEHRAYSRVTLSCLDHPNVIAQQHGQPIPIPGAITLEQLRSMLLEDSIVLQPTDAPEDGDVTLSGVRYRPGPIAQARCLGRRPTLSTTSVWYEQLWARVLATRFEVRPEWPVAIGCDVARYGDNNTVLVVRKGYCLLHAEIHSKVSTATTAQLLRELCERFKDRHNPARKIPCMIDEGGVGSGVIDQADGHLFVPVNASYRPRNPKRYRNVRAELWFMVREAALGGCLDVSRLPPAIIHRLKAELFSARYEVVPGKDQLAVSSKDDIIAMLKRSPDVADATNLACYPPPQKVAA